MASFSLMVSFALVVSFAAVSFSVVYFCEVATPGKPVPWVDSYRSGRTGAGWPRQEARLEAGWVLSPSPWAS